MEAEQSGRGRINLILEDITSLAEELKPLGLGNYDRMFCQLIFQVACGRIGFQLGEYVPDSSQEHTADSDSRNSLAHTKWNCKYHIVFAPKYRRKVFYQEKREAVGKILRWLCEWKGVRIVEAEVCPDHIHMLVEIPPKIAVVKFHGVSERKEQYDVV